MFTPPTPFPRGWFMVAWSDDIPAGTVKPAKYFGRDLVIFRTEAGVARVTDAHCPHLGAHLGHGGTVEGETVRCPFHGWAYDGATGRCANVPHSKRAHPTAALNTWHVHEEAGMVLVWFHEEGAAPTWDFPKYESFDPKKWTPWRGVEWKFRSTVYEVTENDVDCAHMPAVHDFCEDIPGVESSLEGPLMHVTMLTEVTLSTFGVKGSITAPAHTTKVGMGLLLVSQTIDKNNTQIDFRTIGTFTPIDEDHIHVRARHRVKKMKMPFMTGIVERNYYNTFKYTVEQDIPIWENKRYVAKPNLWETDGPIMRFRKWSRQFYPGQELEQEPGVKAAK